MLHHLLESVIPVVISLLELIGVVIILVAGVKAFGEYVMNLIGKGHYNIKIDLGQALSLALEFKMGAEILKTVLVTKMEEIWILGAIIVLRAVLAFVIHWEVSAEKSHQEHKVEEAPVTTKRAIRRKAE